MGRAQDGSYVLAVSTLEPRKNLPGSSRDSAAPGSTASSCASSAPRAGATCAWTATASGASEGVDDEELARLYRGAACVAYVSLYEGFGLPVLEAMACAAPVVAPAGRPYDEFASGVAFDVDPLDPDSIAEGLHQAVAAGAQPAGARRAADFSWERAVQAHVDLYRELAA